ncbi:hypothetical protein V7S43_003357 [Phytophthora oleae]|uniref:HTH CENPB-type domain-containing protein n=1 Tax=Phytophthora oleae TaxID=2107226 RepID=A0ABD3G2K6_9STRA
MQEATKDSKGDAPVVPSSDSSVPPSPQPGNKRKKVARTSLTLREKAIVKSFCEQKVTNCKARGELVPSQEVLRREVVAQFGWSCGRSTLSKIISMDWKLLRSSHEGGEAPRNPDMKRRRRPLFPAFEADLVKFIMAYEGTENMQDGASGATEPQPTEINADENGAPVDNDSLCDARRPLTEALILEEAQRLKQVHGISDDMLVLSVGWLARFKHRHCIHLRKPGAVSNKCMISLHQQNGGSNIEQVSMGMWTGALIPPVLPQQQTASEEAIPHQSEAASRKFEEQQDIEALGRNSFNADAQAKIAQRVRLSNVQKNMEIAIEEMSEASARVTMLYIPCEVNGTQVKAFVDSGAQTTIMSLSCAERCGIMRLVDNAEQAVGVGTATIIGKAHMAPLKIGNEFYNCSFTILDQQGVDFLFGLDMLKRHQCSIDLSKNVLRLREGEHYREVSFLPEYVRLSYYIRRRY